MVIGVSCLQLDNNTCIVMPITMKYVVLNFLAVRQASSWLVVYDPVAFTVIGTSGSIK